MQARPRRNEQPEGGRATESLATVSQKMGEAMYAASAASGASPGGGDGTGGAGASASSDDDVVDAEIVDEGEQA